MNHIYFVVDELFDNINNTTIYVVGGVFYLCKNTYELHLLTIVIDELFDNINHALLSMQQVGCFIFVKHIYRYAYYPKNIQLKFKSINFYFIFMLCLPKRHILYMYAIIWKLSHLRYIFRYAVIIMLVKPTTNFYNGILCDNIYINQQRQL